MDRHADEGQKLRRARIRALIRLPRRLCTAQRGPASTHTQAHTLPATPLATSSVLSDSTNNPAVPATTAIYLTSQRFPFPRGATTSGELDGPEREGCPELGVCAGPSCREFWSFSHAEAVIAHPRPTLTLEHTEGSEEIAICFATPYDHVPGATEEAGPPPARVSKPVHAFVHTFLRLKINIVLSRSLSLQMLIIEQGMSENHPGIETQSHIASCASSFSRHLSR